MKYTQGKWSPGVYVTTETMIERLKAGPQACVCLDENGQPGMVIALCGEAHDEASQSDAQLMSAAPDLFEACEALDQMFTDIELCGGDPSQDEWNIINKMRAALKKARGES